MSDLVSRLAKGFHKKFKVEQAEYKVKEKEVEDLYNDLFRSITIEGTEDEVTRGDDIVANVEGHSNGHLEARPSVLTNTPLQQRSHNDQVGNSAVTGAMMLDNHGVTSNISSHIDDSFGTVNNAAHATGRNSEPTHVDATNPLPLSDCREMLESWVEDVPAVIGEDSRRTELPGSHFPSHEAGPTVAPDSLPNSSLASGLNSNIDNQVQALYLKLVSALQQKNQDLEQKYLKLQHEFLEHMLCCPGGNQPTKKR